MSFFRFLHYHVNHFSPFPFTSLPLFPSFPRWQKQRPSFRAKRSPADAVCPQHNSTHYFRIWEWVATLSEVLEGLRLLQKRYSCTKDRKKKEKKKNHHHQESLWRKGGRVNEKVRNRGRWREDGGRRRCLPKDILVKTPYFAFLTFAAMNNSFLWQSIFLLICRRREETGLKLEREKLKGCNKGFRASKQIALKAARGRGEEEERGGGGKGWWRRRRWCGLVVVSFEERDGRGKRKEEMERMRHSEGVCVSCVCVWGPTQWGLSMWFISEY